MTERKSEPKSVERVYVETLLEKRNRGEKLKPHEESSIAYSPWGSAASCRCGGNRG